jgi:type II secretory pathway component PulM
MIQITPRERLLAAGLAVAVGAWALYGLAIRPANDRIRTLQRIVPEKQAQLQELQTKCTQYTELQNEFARARAQMTSQESDFEVMPFLETMIDRHKLSGHVVTMNPDTLQPQPDYSETVVTIELRDVSLGELIDFLSAVETSKSIVRVGSLHIRRNPKNEALLNSTVGICCPQISPPALATQTAR